MPSTDDVPRARRSQAQRKAILEDLAALDGRSGRGRLRDVDQRGYRRPDRIERMGSTSDGSATALLPVRPLGARPRGQPPEAVRSRRPPQRGGPTTTTLNAAGGSTTTTAAGGSATTSTTSSTSTAPPTDPRHASSWSRRSFKGNWTSTSFTTTAAPWNIGWAFVARLLRPAGPSFQVSVRPGRGSAPTGTPAISETGPSGQSVTTQSSLGPQTLVVQAPAGCTWIVKVTGS